MASLTKRFRPWSDPSTSRNISCNSFQSYGGTRAFGGRRAVPKPGSFRPQGQARCPARGEHERHSISSRRHYRDLGERTVPLDGHDMIAIDAGLVEDDRGVEKSARADILSSSVRLLYQPAAGWIMSQHSVSNCIRKSRTSLGVRPRPLIGAIRTAAAYCESARMAYSWCPHIVLLLLLDLTV